MADALNFRRAAEKLHMAQPPLSAQIRGLEAELGVKLFERTTRTVRLTLAGRAFLESAREVLATAARAEQRAREAGLGLVGTLRIGVIAPSADTRLAGRLRKFRRQFPGIQLSLFDLTSTEQLRRLSARELDLGILRPPVLFPELDSMLIDRSRQILALPAGHELASRRRLTWRDFDRRELVLIHPSAQHGYYDAFFARCARFGATPVPAQYAYDIPTKMWLISAGFGIAPTTATITQVRRPGLVFRDLPPGLPPVKTILVWRREDHSPAVEQFKKLFGGQERAKAEDTRVDRDSNVA